MKTFSFLPPSSLSEWLRNRRAAACMSQDDLARCLHEFGTCTQSNVSKWETDEAIPDAGRLVAITRALGVTDPEDIALRDELALRYRRKSYARRLSARESGSSDPSGAATSAMAVDHKEAHDALAV